MELFLEDLELIFLIWATIKKDPAAPFYSGVDALQKAYISYLNKLSAESDLEQGFVQTLRHRFNAFKQYYPDVESIVDNILQDIQQPQHEQEHTRFLKDDEQLIDRFSDINAPDFNVCDVAYEINNRIKARNILKKNQLLRPLLWKLAFQHKEPYSIAHAFVMLKLYDILTEASCDALAHSSSPFELSIALTKLKKHGAQKAVGNSKFLNLMSTYSPETLETLVTHFISNKKSIPEPVKAKSQIKQLKFTSHQGLETDPLLQQKLLKILNSSIKAMEWLPMRFYAAKYTELELIIQSVSEAFNHQSLDQLPNLIQNFAKKSNQYRYAQHETHSFRYFKKNFLTLDAAVQDKLLNLDLIPLESYTNNTTMIR